MERLSVGSVGAGHMFGECTKTHKLMCVELRDGCLAFMPDNSKGNGMFCLGCGCHCSFHKVENIEQLAIKLNPDTQSQPSGSGVHIVRSYKKYSHEERSKMLAKARELQWMMPGRKKEAKAKLQEFYNEMGIEYRKFRAWLHKAKTNPANYLADY